VCGIVFDGGCDGRGCGCHIFLAYMPDPAIYISVDWWWWLSESEIPAGSYRTPLHCRQHALKGVKQQAL
jgi:hypothetical protein